MFSIQIMDHARAHPGLSEDEPAGGDLREDLTDAGIRPGPAERQRLNDLVGYLSTLQAAAVRELERVRSFRLKAEATRRDFEERPMRALLILVLCSVSLAAQQPGRSARDLSGSPPRPRRIRRSG